ncbi:MAG: serine hydrolase [Bacteroidales bacterium]|nr:serine hydrolase [Bacteroidales bacterium]
MNIGYSQVVRLFVLPFLILVLVIGFVNLNAQSLIIDDNHSAEQRWVDSVFNQLSLQERIGQLIMIRAHSDKGVAYARQVEDLIEKYHVGGVCFFQGGPVRQARISNQYQKTAKVPLFVAMDAEWGLGMRLDSTYSFPRQMTLGAIQDDQLVYEMGEEIAYQLRRLGVNVNFAPVVDVNNNPNNPVINSRSFGQDIHNVSRKGIAYMQALQNNGVLATAKHFPGHGDTDSDSHFTLPVISHQMVRLDSLEMFPFKEMIYNGLGGVMSAHLFVPALDANKNTASSLSWPIVTGVLKHKLGFEGLIFTDGLEMNGVSKYHEPGKLEVKALLAGNDVLLLPIDVPAAVTAIQNAIAKEIISESDVNAKCLKVLTHKYRLGLNKLLPVEEQNLIQDLNNDRNDLITRALVAEALTLLRNQDSIIPLKSLDTLSIAAVALNDNSFNKFQKTLNMYSQIDTYNFSEKMSSTQKSDLKTKLDSYNLIIVSVHSSSNSASRNYGISKQQLEFIKELQRDHKIILDVFANPYLLGNLPELNDNVKALIVSYENGDVYQDLSAQMIFGGIPAKGKLPVTANDEFLVGTGLYTQECRLAYVSPSQLNIDKNSLLKIDSVIEDGILKKAYPGCQILAVKDGKIFFNKSYGFHTYDKKNQVKSTDLYDIASLTKIIATTPLVMELSDRNIIQIDRKLSYYFPPLRLTNKKDLIIRDVLAHQANLTPWIPYFLNTLDEKGLSSEMYSETLSEEYCTHVTNKLYLRKDYDFIIRDEIYNSELLLGNEYKYSDLGFIMMYFTLENLLNAPYENIVDKDFYKPLGMNYTGYLPTRNFPLKQIIPTEDDQVFRHQLLHGDVHDQAAAMLGGVCGHAGLFSNANDLAKMLQMFLNNGSYGGQQYIKASTLNEFTSRQFPLNSNRRGLGFDKPWPEEKERSPVCEKTSLQSYGHSGFTGTLAWVDPQNGLIYIFLSNRIHPSADNKGIYELDIRWKVHELLYQAVESLAEQNFAEANDTISAQ